MMATDLGCLVQSVLATGTMVTRRIKKSSSGRSDEPVLDGTCVTLGKHKILDYET